MGGRGGVGGTLLGAGGWGDRFGIGYQRELLLYILFPLFACLTSLLQVISARGGPLTVTVSWRKTSVPDEVVDRFCAGFEMAVTRLSSGDALSEDLTLSGLLCVE